MSIVSFEFILLIVLTLGGYLLLPKNIRWTAILAASMYFYIRWGGLMICFILVSSLTFYLAGLRIEVLLNRQREYLKSHKTKLSSEQKKAYKSMMGRKRSAWSACCIVLNVGILAYMKYSGFGVSCANSALRLFNAPFRFTASELIIPLGISFYTLQLIGYLADVAGEKYNPEHNFFRFLLFTSFFPQLIQGPISRYDMLSKTLFSGKGWDRENVSRAAWRILWGYFKKLVVADRVGIAVASLTGSPEKYKGVLFLFAALLYAIQMYADFTGGIDVAIGVSGLFGVTLPENFNFPFLSRNIEDYWRKWHITLGAWFRDYVFYPLSTSKAAQKVSKFSRAHFGDGFGKRVPVYLATLIVWFLTGLWHGASGNFILWGMLNGVIIIISQLLSPLYVRFDHRFGLRSKGYYPAFEVVRTFCMISMLRILDCYRVRDYLKLVGSVIINPGFSRFNGELMMSLGLTAADWWVILFGVVCMIGWSALSQKKDMPSRLASSGWLVKTAAAAFLLTCVLVLGAYGEGYQQSQFIYNRF